MTRGMEWAGGLFEGEGTFGIHKPGNRPWKFKMVLAMTDEDSVRYFHEAVGVGAVSFWNPPSFQIRDRKPLWRWRVVGAPALQLAWQLYPVLGKRRQDRIIELLNEIGLYNADRIA
jgi:hypothetical protein